MILVVNLNVSLDKHYELDAFVPNTVMRAAAVENTPGGERAACCRRFKGTGGRSACHGDDWWQYGGIYRAKA